MIPTDPRTNIERIDVEKNHRPMGTSLTLFTIGALVLMIGGFIAYNSYGTPVSMTVLIGTVILCSGFVVSVLEGILHEMRKQS